MENLGSSLAKELSSNIVGSPQLRTTGSTADQYKGLGDELMTRFIPFAKSEYKAEQFLIATVQTNDPYLEYFDFVTPVVNVQGKSVQGVASFVAAIPYPVSDTFVLRMVGLSHKLVPHSLVVEQGMKPKQVLKGGKITSRAIQAINKDKLVNRALYSMGSCKVMDTGLSNKFYKVSFDHFKYPPGFFTIVPYKGFSLLIAKEAGGFGAQVDSPSYNFKMRFTALAGVARYLATYPEEGEEKVGTFYLDSSLKAVLPGLVDMMEADVAAREKLAFRESMSEETSKAEPTKKVKKVRKVVQAQNAPPPPAQGGLESQMIPLKICPNCKGEIEITSSQRPLVVSCPGCKKRYRLKT